MIPFVDAHDRPKRLESMKIIAYDILSAVVIAGLNFELFHMHLMAASCDDANENNGRGHAIACGLSQRGIEEIGEK